MPNSYITGEELIRPGRKRFRIDNRHRTGKVNRKRGDYDAFDDKESLAHIDVASFIQNPDDASFNGYEKKGRRPASNYIDDNLIMNAEYNKDRSLDYQGLESNNIPEVNIYSGKRIHQHPNINTHPNDEINENLYKSHEIKSVRDNTSFDTNHRHAHAEKKCILKNMKIPFFSRDKVTTSKTKKNKKRKLFGFRNSKKNTNLTKFTGSNSNDVRLTTKEPQSFKINKRSYFEKLCPVCKQKFMSNSNTDFMEKFRRTANNVIHNSRQYYQNKIYGKAESDERSNSSPIKHQNMNSNPKFNNINYNDYSKEKRR
ncbi:unnamed protein product [Euphydryas editha]|uniref:Uncharacterized protein n=1 Tax=Euphydryas editha TaxID=104508 RepID=A0AAU9TQU2_EUPED|nr:unnamed protein product [Euphydryas editha]